MEAIQIYKSKKNNQILEIFQDDSPSSPRDNDNICTMLCAHKGYNLGDEQFTSEDDVDARIKELKPLAQLPLYLLDHSGLRINTEGFTDCDPQGWDWGQVGYIIVTKEKLDLMCGEDKFTKERLNEILLSEVEQYDDYLAGNVFGYKLSEKTTCSEDEVHLKEIDSCWGFIGDIDKCLEGTDIDLKEFEQIV